MKVTGIALAAAAALVAGAAHAQQEASGPGRAANLYIGAAYGKSKADDVCSHLASCDKRDNVFGAFAGYRFRPGFAAEAGYYNLGKATAPGGTYVRSNVWELVGVGTWRPREPFALYAKLGGYRGAQEGGGLLQAPKELTTAITYGLGGQADLTKNLSLRGEWQNYPNMGGGPVLPKNDIRVIRAGVVWRYD